MTKSLNILSELRSRMMSSSLFFLFFFFNNILCQEVILYSYQESGSLSNCSDGYRAGYDEIVFNSRVDFSEASRDWGRNVKFDVSSASIKKTFAVDLLSLCEKKINRVCNCINRTVGEVYFTSCRFKEDFVGDTYITASLTGLRGRLVNSEQQKFPKIYSQTSLQMFVNDEKIRNSTCNFEMDPTAPAIAACCYGNPSPCYVSIHSRGHELARGTQCAHAGVPEIRDKYKVVFSVCGEEMVFQCVTNNQAFIGRDNQRSQSKILKYEMINFMTTYLIFAVFHRT